MNENIEAKEVLHEEIKKITDKFPNTIAGGESIDDIKEQINDLKKTI